ncbi:MAG: TonB-dependent receptor plug domain-containing protein [Bacteroidales bacterium]|nr:TonB-dependent receptor plug domain-containing protein [Bacteroidales bacterium]MBP5390039.1 TonB-dependent receptor plug domain-containing protein [Bacteroidales bacterium]MBP5634779.1 TonB-dependent receptor plug domain-containing protein [Bacteroidales bacterium]
MKKTVILMLASLLLAAACGTTKKASFDSSLERDALSQAGESASRSTLRMNERDAKTYTTMQDYLRGKVPGVRVNSDGTINIRGVNSVNAQAQPLILLDGAEIRDINSVNPNEVKSVDVIKDGAAAIYGFRGVAGVISIKTK